MHTDTREPIGGISRDWCGLAHKCAELSSFGLGLRALGRALVPILLSFQFRLRTREALILSDDAQATQGMSTYGIPGLAVKQERGPRAPFVVIPVSFAHASLDPDESLGCRSLW